MTLKAEMTWKATVYASPSVTYWFLSPSPRGKPQEKCPLCQASFCPEYKGIVCTVCKVGKLSSYYWGISNN